MNLNLQEQDFVAPRTGSVNPNVRTCHTMIVVPRMGSANLNKWRHSNTAARRSPHGGGNLNLLAKFQWKIAEVAPRTGSGNQNSLDKWDSRFFSGRSPYGERESK